MTGNKCLLDSNVIVDLMSNDTAISYALNKVDLVYVPVIVKGELEYGALYSANPDKHLSKFSSFLVDCTLLPIDGDTAKVYANIKVLLRKKGKPIPDNDIWIAAIAIQHNIPLYTRDSHFNEIEGIQLFQIA